MEIIYDKNVLNSEYTSGPFSITEDLIRKFKSAHKPSELTCQFDEGVSAEICNLFISSLNKPDIKLDFGNVDFFSGQTVDFLSNVKAGDKLTATTKLLKVYAKTGRSGKMIFTEWNTVFINQNAKLISNMKESFVRINI